MYEPEFLQSLTASHSQKIGDRPIEIKQSDVKFGNFIFQIKLKSAYFLDWPRITCMESRFIMYWSKTVRSNKLWNVHADFFSTVKFVFVFKNCAMHNQKQSRVGNHCFLLFCLFPQTVKQTLLSILEILKNSNSLLPPAILASTLLALIFPPSLTWFTTRYVYVPDELVD
jgi:hypothetical protein